MNTKTYKYIVAWGRYTGSYSYYIKEQVACAREENAPEDALYKSTFTKDWVCYSEIIDTHAQIPIDFIVNQMEGGK